MEEEEVMKTKNKKQTKTFVAEYCPYNYRKTNMCNRSYTTDEVTSCLFCL